MVVVSTSWWLKCAQTLQPVLEQPLESTCHSHQKGLPKAPSGVVLFVASISVTDETSTFTRRRRRADQASCLDLKHLLEPTSPSAVQ